VHFHLARGLEHLGPASKNHWLSGLRHFIKWLLERKILSENPAKGVERPPVPPPRIKYLNYEQAKRLADQQPSPFREFSAVLNGTGGDVSLVLGLHVRDVDTEHQELHLNGATEKTPYRDRWTKVASRA
jgi:site-specific recombinase XerC